MSENLKQGKIRASKKKNAIIKLKRKFKGSKATLVAFEKVKNNTWEYLVKIS